MATVSYVRITDTDTGVALSGDGGTWTPVTGVSFATSSGTGSTVSSDLTFALPQSDGIAPALQTALENGTPLQVEVATYDTDGAAAGSAGTLLSYDVYGATGAPAFLDGAALKGGSADQYSVASRASSHMAYAGGAPTSSALLDGVSVKATPAPSDVLTGALARPTGAAPSLSGLSYYVRFEDASGKPVQGSGGSAWLAVTGVSSGLSTAVSFPAGGHGHPEIGAPSVSEVSFTLADRAADAPLFRKALAEISGGTVQIEAVDASGKVVDSTTYRDALLSGFDSGSAATSVSVNFASFYGQHVGATGAVTGSGYDLSTGLPADSSIADPIVALNTAGAAPQAAGTFSLRYDTIDGTTAVSDVAFGVGRGISTPQGKAAHRETSAPSVSEVTFEAPEGAYAAALDAQLGGTAGRTVDIGEAVGKAQVEKYELTNTLLSGSSIDLVTGQHSLSLNFTRVLLSEPSAADPTGGGTPSVTYDLGSTKTDAARVAGPAVSRMASPTLAASTGASGSDNTVSVSASPTPAQTPPASGNTAYVQFRDASGDVITAGPNGPSWFQVTAGSVGFGRGISTPQGNTASRQTPPPVASQLSLTLGTDAIAAKLDGLLGTDGLTAEVANYDGDGALAGDYIFADGGPMVSSTAGASDSLSFAYKQFQETGYTPGAPAQTASLNIADPSTPFSAPVLAPTQAPPATHPAPAALTTYVEIVDGNGDPITGSRAAPFVLATNVQTGLEQAAYSGTGATAAPSFSLDIADGGVPSALDAAAGSTATAFGAVLVSFDAADPSKLVSEQTLGGYTLSEDALDGAGQRELTFEADADAGAYKGNSTVPAGYTETVADDDPKDGSTSFSTPGASRPKLPDFSGGIGAYAGPIGTPTPNYAVEVLGAGGANLTGTASNGFVGATGVVLNFGGRTASFSVAASALPALTAALASGAHVTVKIQSSSGGGTRGYALGGGPGATATITGCALDAGTGLADVSVAFTGSPSRYGSTAAPTLDPIAGGPLTASATPTYTGTAAPGSTVTVTVDGKPVGSTAAGAGGAFSLTQPTALGDGPHTAFATAQLGGTTVSAGSEPDAFTVDATAPALASETVDGGTLVLGYTETGSGLAPATPATGDYAVEVGGASDAVTDVKVDAAAGTVTLDLARAASASDAVTIGYAPEADAAGRLRDVAGNAAAGFAGQAVVNTTAPATALPPASPVASDPPSSPASTVPPASPAPSPSPAPPVPPVSTLSPSSPTSSPSPAAPLPVPSSTASPASIPAPSPTPAPTPTTTTVQNPDGSTTTTTLNPDGSTLTATSDPDGTTSTTLLAPDGTSTATVLAPDGTATTTVSNPDGTSTVRTEGGPAFDGLPYSAATDFYAADGSLLAEVRDRDDGSHGVIVGQGGQTLGSDFFDTFANAFAQDNTFVFDPGHGLDVVRQFVVRGDGHDTLSFTGSDFDSDIAELLRNTRNTAGGVVIHDPTSGDTVKLANVSKVQLIRNQQDFAFH